MLYKVLIPDELLSLQISDGLRATHPNSYTSVFNYVINKDVAGCQSPYILTCGSLSSVLKLRIETQYQTQGIVQISEDNLPVGKIDLRTFSSRCKHYIRGIDSNTLINLFHNAAREYEMVLLVGHVPNMHVQVLSESDFNDEQLPLI